MKLFKLTVSGALFLCLFIFLLNPEKYSSAVSEGILLWATSLLPSMLPFMLISRLILNEGSAAFLFSPVGKLLKKAFGVNHAFALPYVAGILSGYPIAADLSSRLMQSNAVSKIELKRFISFSLTVSPIFVLGTISTLCFDSRLYAIIIFVSHLFGCFLTGLLLSRVPRKAFPETRLSAPPTLILNKTDVYTILKECIITCLAIGGYISVFFMISEMLSLLPVSQEISVFIQGFLEMSNGCFAAAALFSPKTAAVVICCFVSFGGLCVNMQCFSFLSHCGIKLSELLFAKLLNAAFSSLLCFIALTLLIS